jgi:hypothetical protein
VKLPRRWTASLLILLLLLVALTLAVRFLLPVDRFVQSALADLNAGSGIEVSVGKARVDLWPTPRVVLSGVAAIPDPAARAAAPGGASWLLKAKSATLRPDWRELAGGRAALRDVRLAQPRWEWVLGDGVTAGATQAAAVTIHPVPGCLRLRVDEADWNGTAVSADAEWEGWPGPGRLQGAWRLERCDPGALSAALPRRPVLGRTPVAGLAGGKVEASGGFDWAWPLPAPVRFRDLAPGLTGNAEVSDLAVSFAGSDAPWNVRARAGLRDGRLEVSDVVVGIGDGRVTGRFDLTDLGRDEQRCSFEAGCEAIGLADLLRVLAPGAVSYVTGTADAGIRGGFACGRPGAAVASLEIDADIEARDGVVHAREWLTDVASYLGERRDLQDIRYRTLTGRLTLREGRLATQDLKLEGPDTDWRVAGRFDLAGPLDLILIVKLPAGFRPDLGSMSPFADLLKGDDGRIVLGLRLTGRAGGPEVSLDLANSGRQAGWR